MLREGEVADALDEIISGVVAGTIKEAEDGQMVSYTSIVLVRMLITM